MPTAYVLLNSDLGTDVSIITEIKQILTEENVEYEVRGVYGVYDIVLKISSDDAEKLRAIICRFGTIYGFSPGIRFHTAVNKFCFQAVFNQKITIWKTAYNQKRPYLDLIDAVNAIAFIINQNIFDGEVYNILT